MVLSSEEGGPQELAPFSQDHEHLDVDQHSLQEELSPAVTGEAAVSPEEPTPQEDSTGTVTPPEYLMPDDTKGAELQDADTVEPLTSDQGEVTKVDAASDETEPAEMSPDGTPEEIDPTGTSEGIPAENWSQISAIPPKASRDTDANIETENDSLGLSKEEDKDMFETEGTSQEDAASEQFASEQPAVEVPAGFTDTEEDQEEASPALLSKSEGEEETSEPAAEVAPTDEEPPPSVLAEDESDVSLAPGGRLETADDETAVEEVVVLSDNSEEELEETIPKASAESSDEEASEEHKQLETEENAEQNSPDSISLLEEDETVAVISDVDEESKEDPAATILSTVEAVEEMPQEEVNLLASHQEHSEGTEVETADVITPNSPNDGDAAVVEEEVIFISNKNENNQEGAIAVVTSNSPLEEPEEVLEEMVLYVSAEAFHQEPLKETEVETRVTSTANIVPAAPEEDQTVALTFDLDKESHRKAAEVLATEEPPISLLQEPDPEDLVLVVVLEDSGENSDSIHSGFQPEDAAEETEASELVVSGTVAAQEDQEPGEVQVPRTDNVMVPVLPVASDGGDRIPKHF